MDADIHNARTGLETLITVSRDRDHWAIENSCHWVLDTLFREDHNPTRRNNRAKNHSTMRRTANNTLKRPPRSQQTQASQQSSEKTTPRRPRRNLTRTMPLPSVGPLNRNNEISASYSSNRAFFSSIPSQVQANLLNKW